MLVDGMSSCGWGWSCDKTIPSRRRNTACRCTSWSMRCGSGCPRRTSAAAARLGPRWVIATCSRSCPSGAASIAAAAGCGTSPTPSARWRSRSLTWRRSAGAPSIACPSRCYPARWCQAWTVPTAGGLRRRTSARCRRSSRPASGTSCPAGHAGWRHP